MRDMFTSIVIDIAYAAADRFTWLGLYQPKKPEKLQKK